MGKWPSIEKEQKVGNRHGPSGVRVTTNQVLSSSEKLEVEPDGRDYGCLGILNNPSTGVSNTQILEDLRASIQDHWNNFCLMLEEKKLMSC